MSKNSKKNDLQPHVHPSHVEAAAGTPTGKDRADRVAAAFPLTTNDEGATPLPPSESVHTETGLVHRPGLDVTRQAAKPRRGLHNKD